MTTNLLRVTLGMLAGGLMLMTPSASASTWSTAASVCEPGSDSIGLYTYNVAQFMFSGTNTGTIKTRCTVTNPLDSGVPAWTTLTVGYLDPDGTGINYQVNAQLNRVNKATGVSFTIKTFDSSSFSTTTATSHSVTFTHTFDFTNFAYFVTLSVIRVDANQSPAVWYAQLK
jgi:hypothetical protein